MSATIKYKGNTIVSITTDSSKTLKTSGKYCEGDIVVENVQDVSDKYEKAIGHKPKEPLYEVDVTVDCYGVVERDRRFMDKSEFEQAKKQGYFLA